MRSPTANECKHTPRQRYTRYPCSCDRQLWPPRGRGRGEALYSPRRIEAKLKALEAMQRHAEGETYKRIAHELGYRSASGAWMAVQRLRDEDAAWRRWELETGKHSPAHRQRTQQALDEAIRHIEHELTTGGLDGERLQRATERLRHLLVDETKRRRQSVGLRKRDRFASA